MVAASRYLVTPGNRAAAVVGGFTVIIFTVITVLDHKERLRGRRDGQPRSVFASSDSSPQSTSIDEKKLPVVGEVNATP